MSRRDRWEVDLLDRRDRLKAARLSTSDGRLGWSIFRSVPGTGSIRLKQTPSLGIDWLNDRIRITHIDGQRRTPMGVWLLSMPGWDTDGPVTHTTIQLSDKCESLNSPIGEWVTVPAGTNVVQRVVSILRARGESLISATDSPLTLAAPQTWDPTEDTTWLTVVNDLLATINYSSLWADMHGNLRVDPYRAPEQRPQAGAYGEQAGDLLMTPAWSDEADLWSLPTGVRAHVEGDETTPGFVGRANLPASHPVSAANRGGVEWLRTERIEAPSQAVATERAQRILDDSMQVLRSVSVTHPIDATEMNDVVLHRPTGLRAAIVERSVAMAVGAVVTDRIRHIYTGGELPWPLS